MSSEMEISEDVGNSVKNHFEKDLKNKATLPWKEWKQKKKEVSKKWKEAKAIKEMKKLEKQQLEEAEANTSSTIENDQFYTISIAVPGSILDKAQSPELKTYLAGQIARAAAVFKVNEIIVFDETGTANITIDNDESLRLHRKNHGCVQMVRILQYLECPQYLRKYYFPMHKDLEYAGLLNPLDIPHHLREDDELSYREGIVLDKPVKSGRGSFVYIGKKMTAIIDKALVPRTRVTVKLSKEQSSKKHFKGMAVSPVMPYKADNIYWGYDVRLAKSLPAVFEECPFKNGYDLTIGTSDKGQDVDSCELPHFKHLLVVFGGLKGLEGCLEGDETIEAQEAHELFQFYLNTCPSQGSRTIRTEEAILITLSSLRAKIVQVQRKGL